MRNGKIYLFFLLIAQLILVPANVFALDSTQVQTTQLETTYSRPVLVQVVNTPLPTRVVSEPTTTRNVNVVGEPATPRDVNVINTVDVSASQPLPVQVETEGVNPADYFSASVYLANSVQPVIFTTVPEGKLLLITDLIGYSSENSGFTFGGTTDPATITDIRLKVNIGASSTSTINLQTPIVFTSGQQVSAVSFLGGCGLSIVGKFVDAQS